jgi:very-short-patch-repair endonuclease
MQGSTRATQLRKNLTNAEQLLWYRLRDRRLNGHKFRRQVPIGPFVADFVLYVLAFDRGN